MAWADLVLPEERLATMLAASQVWRAIVANPGLAWSQIAAVLDEGTVAEGNAAYQIKTGVWSEEISDANTIERPRALVTDTPEDDQWSRVSSPIGHDLNGRVFLMIETDIPVGITNDANAKLDVRRKGMALQLDLLSQPQAYPNLDIVSLGVNQGVVYPSNEKGAWFQVIQMTIGYRGVN